MAAREAGPRPHGPGPADRRGVRRRPADPRARGVRPGAAACRSTRSGTYGTRPRGRPTCGRPAARRSASWPPCSSQGRRGPAVGARTCGGTTRSWRSPGRSAGCSRCGATDRGAGRRCPRWRPAGATRVLRTAPEPVRRGRRRPRRSWRPWRGTASWPTPSDRRDLIVAGAQDDVYPDGAHRRAGSSTRWSTQITYLVEPPTPLLGDVRRELPRAARRGAHHGDAQAPALPAGARRGPARCCRCSWRWPTARSTSTLVRAGNEAVLRARYEDAAFFYRADRRTPLAATAGPAVPADLHRPAGLDGRPGGADRRAGAGAGRRAVGLPTGATLDRAAALVKFDLGSQLVTEMTSLAGVMARDYALHAGEPPAVAQAVVRGRAAPATPATTCRRRCRARCCRWPTASTWSPAWPPRSGCRPAAATRSRYAGPCSACSRCTGRTRRWPGSVLTEALAAAARRQPVDVPDRVARRRRRVPAPAGSSRHWSRRASRSTGSARRCSTPTGRRWSTGCSPSCPHWSVTTTFEAVAAAIQRARRIVPDGTPPGYDPALLNEPAEVALHEAVRSVLEQAPGGPDPVHPGGEPDRARRWPRSSTTCS